MNWPSILECSIAEIVRFSDGLRCYVDRAFEILPNSATWNVAWGRLMVIGGGNTNGHEYPRIVTNGCVAEIGRFSSCKDVGAIMPADFHKPASSQTPILPIPKTRTQQ